MKALMGSLQQQESEARKSRGQLNEYFKSYDCLSDMTSEVVHSCQTYDLEKDRHNCKSWYGADSIEEVIDIIERGWSEGLDKAQKDLSVVELPRLTNVRRRRARASFGDDIDMQRVYAGDLDRAWGTTHREIGLNQTHQRAVIVCNVSTACSMSADEFFWRGAVTTMIADTLVNSGRPVKIVGYAWGRRAYTNGGDQKFIMTVKDYDEPMLPEKVIATLGFAGFFRYYGFKQILSAPQEATMGLGTPVQGRLPDEVAEEYPCEFIVIEDIWNKTAAQGLLDSLEQRLKHKL